MNAFNAKSRASEVAVLLDDYIPGVEKFGTKLNKAAARNRELRAENEDLKDKLTDAENAGREKIKNRLEQAELKKEVEELRATVARIPEEIMQAYADHKNWKTGITAEKSVKTEE